jgi:hypothetical protein
MVDDVVEDATLDLGKAEPGEFLGCWIHEGAALLLIHDEEGRRRVVGDGLG